MMGNGKSKSRKSDKQNTKQTAASTVNFSSNDPPLSEPAEVEAKDPVQWCIQNRYHADFWSKLHSLSYEQTTEMKKQLKMNDKGQSQKEKLSQEQDIDKNKERIQYLLKNNIHVYAGKFKEILTQCSLIANYKIPEALLDILISYVGNGSVAIRYTLSAMPFHSPVRFDVDNASKYSIAMQRWWDEVRLSPDHQGIFHPLNIKNAAQEFDEFLIARLAEGGDGLKYQHSMIPHVFIPQEFNVLQPDVPEPTVVTLPTEYSKCLGGIEMFQRLYMEACFNNAHDAFVVDLQHIQQTHGDNWCFDGDGDVLMADMRLKKMHALRVGDRVRAFPNKVATVQCVIVSVIQQPTEMVRLDNGCWITFEHPVLVQTGEKHTDARGWNIEKYSALRSLDSDVISSQGLEWKLPKDIYPTTMKYMDRVFNFVLDEHHTINVNGNWCCTLGHNYKGAVIEHEFWGNSNAVHSFLQSECDTCPYVVFSN